MASCVEERRQVTSAIEGMSVADVRRGLDYMRRKWKLRGSDNPFYICDTIFNDMSMQEFGFRFVMGHHHKRHNKSRRNDALAKHENNVEEEKDEEETMVADVVVVVVTPDHPVTKQGARKRKERLPVTTIPKQDETLVRMTRSRAKKAAV